jgi:hypothetical protein
LQNCCKGYDKHLGSYKKCSWSTTSYQTCRAISRLRPRRLHQEIDYLLNMFLRIVEDLQDVLHFALLQTRRFVQLFPSFF